MLVEDSRRVLSLHIDLHSCSFGHTSEPTLVGSPARTVPQLRTCQVLDVAAGVPARIVGQYCTC